MVTRTRVQVINSDRPNLLINSGFDFTQRIGTNTASYNVAGTPVGGVDTYYGFDRWMIRPAGSGAGVDASISTDVPTGDMNQSMRVVENSDLDGNNLRFFQRIEADTIRPFIGRTMCYSIWLKNEVFQYPSLSLGATRPATAKDTWNADPNSVDVTIDIGAVPFTLTLGLWTRVHHSFVVTPDMANGLSFRLSTVLVYSGAAQLKLAGAMFTEGSKPPERFYRSSNTMGEELSKCQRYFEKSYPLATAVGTASTTGQRFFRTSLAISNSEFTSIQFSVHKRATPAVRAYSPLSGGLDKLRNNTVGADRTCLADSISAQGFNLRYNDTITGASDVFYYHWAADAEL